MLTLAARSSVVLGLRFGSSASCCHTRAPPRQPGIGPCATGAPLAARARGGPAWLGAPGGGHVPWPCWHWMPGGAQRFQLVVHAPRGQRFAASLCLCPLAHVASSGRRLIAHFSFPWPCAASRNAVWHMAVLSAAFLEAKRSPPPSCPRRTRQQLHSVERELVPTPGNVA